VCSQEWGSLEGPRDGEAPEGRKGDYGFCTISLACPDKEIEEAHRGLGFVVKFGAGFDGPTFRVHK